MEEEDEMCKNLTEGSASNASLILDLFDLLPKKKENKVLILILLILNYLA